LTRLEAPWLATSRNWQESLYHDGALVGTLCCCDWFFEVYKANFKIKAKPYTPFHFRAKNRPL